MRAHPAGPMHGEFTMPVEVPMLPDSAAMARIDPQIWPATARRDAHGALMVGGLSVNELAAKHGTPVLVLDEADFRARAAAFQSAYTDRTVPGSVSFAGKSFLSATTVRWLAEEGLGLDVCTGGELALSLAAGFPPGGSACTGTTSPRPSSPRRCPPGWGATSSTHWRRSIDWQTSRRRPVSWPTCSSG